MEKLIEVYNSIHGNKYNYSHSDFNLLKIKIECPEHGIFEQNKYKNQYCIDNNIKLIRIPYNEDVESILKMQLFN